MLDKFPHEIVLLILSHLTTISAISAVAQVNRELYEIVSTNGEAIYHGFVLRQFPTISAHGPWNKTVFSLTSRARAWERRAFIARECAAPKLAHDGQALPPRGQNFGFMPVIDSYESSSTVNEEALAWGAAGRLILRKTSGKFVRWSTYSVPDDASPHTDILDLRLLRPHQNKNRFGETIFIRRANRELALLNAMPEQDNWVKAATYMVKPDTSIDCVDVNDSSEPLLAVCDTKSIQLFPLHASQGQNRADQIVPVNALTTTKQRKRCAKFMGNSTLAIATQYLEGLQQGPIEVFDIAEAGMSREPLTSLRELEAQRTTKGLTQGRIGANVLAKVDDASESSSSSQLLLSGWSDGFVRLYDMRAGNTQVRQFWDPVDDGQIFSLLPIGRERFFAGSHQNACLKMFDMRMNGRVYSYLDFPKQQRRDSRDRVRPQDYRINGQHSYRGMNIFLALTVNRAAQPWQPLPGRQNNARLPRYRGSIYSLSSPSAYSRTLYAGIENHVIQLDFVNTDDWLKNKRGIREELDDRSVLNLSCYERPRQGFESTDTVLLRKQADLDDSVGMKTNGEVGWDERWQLEQQRSRRGMAASWWSGRP